MLLVYIGPYFDPNTAWVFTLLGLGYPYLLFINILFIILWLVFWKKYTWMSLAIVLLGVAHLDRLYGLSGSGLDVEGHDLSVLSLNTQSLRGVDFKGADFNELVNYAQSTDIILLQESHQSTTNKLALSLSEHGVYQSKEVSLAILSKHPIEGAGLVNKENSANGSIWIDINIDGQPLRVYNAHLQSYRVTQATSDIIDHAELGDEKTWTDVKSVIGKIRDMSKRRSGQVSKISKHIATAGKPILLGGDFNDTPVSNTYRRLSGNLIDTFCAAGRGVGTTYAGKIPLLRIDYIFADASFAVVDHQVIDSPISDHYPIKSVIRLQPD